MPGKRKLELHGFRVEHSIGHGYVVVYPQGNRVSKWTKFRAFAERWRDDRRRDADRAASRGWRTCMCCAAMFQSEGIHHRLSDRCGRADVGPVAMAYARPQRRGDGAAG